MYKDRFAAKQVCFLCCDVVAYQFNLGFNVFDLAHENAIRSLCLYGRIF